MKQLIIVYQDCPVCGNRKEWGEQTIGAAKNAKAHLRKVSFVTHEGEKLIAEAVQNGITRLPFVTDGKIFAYDAKSVLEAKSDAKSGKKQAKKSARKTKKVSKDTNEPD